MRYGRLVALTVLDVFFASPTSAAPKVTLCQSDVQPGPGLNLSQALTIGGHIEFDCDGSGASATIIITHPHDVKDGTTIDGQNKIVLDGQRRSAMFRVLPGPGNPEDGAFRLSHITLRGGNVSAGYDGSVADAALHVYLDHVRVEQSTSPIRVRGATLTVTDSIFSDNESGVAVARNFTLERSQFRNNSGSPVINDAPGRIEIDSSEFSVNGHVIAGPSDGVPCTLHIRDTSFAGNQERLAGALVTGCDTTISGGGFVNNAAFDGDGGAIAITGDAPRVELRRVRFENNRTQNQGGAIVVASSGVPATVSLRSITFLNNAAGRGGAIDFGEHSDRNLDVRVTMSVFKGNTAKTGGAIFGAVAPWVNRAVFVDNVATADDGGGAFALVPLPRRRTIIANTVLARNNASHGSAVLASSVDLINNTIVANMGGPALEAGHPNLSVPPLFRLSNSIVAANPGDGCRMSAQVDFEDGGHNLQFPGTACGASIEVAEPFLDGLYVPQLGSPALNRGDDAVCISAPVSGIDILGQKRPRGPHCTIGAYEGDVERFTSLFWRDRREHPVWPWEHF